MKYHIDEHSGVKAYLQLYYQLRADITGGVYPCGARLPSKRILAEESGVSVITVEHCYSLLCDEGYVEARQRSGYFVIYREDDFVSSEAPVPAPTGQSGHSHTASGRFPFTVLARTLRKVLQERGEDILVKSPNHGCPELRSAICAYLARSVGITASAEQIIVGSGAEYLYSMVVQLLGRECVFGLENPSYEKIRRVYHACGVECDLLRMGRDGIRSPELERTGAKVLHVTPFRSFPSGVTASASKRAEYIRWAEKRGGWIIEDNYDSELTVSSKHEDTLFSVDAGRSVIYLNTFSRTVAPSIRVGYMVLPERLLEEFERRLGFYSCTVPLLEQYMLAELLTSGDFERHINRVRRARRKEAEEK